MKPLYWILLAIDALVVAVLVFFFLWGVIDSRVSVFNGTFWLAMIAVPAAVIAGAMLAWRHGQRLLAIVLLILPPIPPLALGLFFLALIHDHPNWR